MQKIILPLLFLLFASSVANAQLGLYAGANGSYNLVFIVNQNTYGDPEYRYAATTGFIGGPHIGLQFMEAIGVHTGLQFAALGQRYEDVQHGVDIVREVNLNYMLVPVLVRYTSPMAPVRFFAMAGPQFGMLTSAAIDYVAGEDDRSLADARHRFNESDIGLKLVTGAELRLSTTISTDIGIHMYYGLTDINHPDWHVPDRTGVYEASKNAYGGLNVGLKFHIF